MLSGIKLECNIMNRHILKSIGEHFVRSTWSSQSTCISSPSYCSQHVTRFLRVYVKRPWVNMGCRAAPLGYWCPKFWCHYVVSKYWASIIKWHIATSQQKGHFT